MWPRSVHSWPQFQYSSFPILSWPLGEGQVRHLERCTEGQVLILKSAYPRKGHIYKINYVGISYQNLFAIYFGFFSHYEVNRYLIPLSPLLFLRLEELQTFLLYKNKLTYLPYALLNLKKLTLLVVSGDHLVEFPTALCDSSTPLKWVDSPIETFTHKVRRTCSLGAHLSQEPDRMVLALRWPEPGSQTFRGLCTGFWSCWPMAWGSKSQRISGQMLLLFEVWKNTRPGLPGCLTLFGFP